MKKILLCMLVCFAFSWNGAVAAAPQEREKEEFLLESVFADLSVEKVNAFIHSMNRELDGNLPELTLGNLKEIAFHGGNFDLQKIMEFLLQKAFQELAAQTGLMGKLLFLAILCAMLQNLQNAFEKSGISLLAYSVCFCFLAVFAMKAFYEASQIAVQAISAMATFMEALLPLLLTLLAAAGALTSAALFSPFMLFVVNAITSAVKLVVLPLLLFGAALECTDYLTDKYKLTELASFFKQAAMLILGFSMVIFIGVITIQGASGFVADGLALRTAKFAASAFIPVVGKVFADTVELVMGASLMLKNAIGIFGVLVIGMICLTPLLKMFAVAAAMKFTGALIEPMGDPRMSKCLARLGNNLCLIAGALLTVTLMFFLTVTMIVGVGSAAVMLR